MWTFIQPQQDIANDHWNTYSKITLKKRERESEEENKN